MFCLISAESLWNITLLLPMYVNHSYSPQWGKVKLHSWRQHWSEENLPTSVPRHGTCSPPPMVSSFLYNHFLLAPVSGHLSIWSSQILPTSQYPFITVTFWTWLAQNKLKHCTLGKWQDDHNPSPICDNNDPCVKLICLLWFSSRLLCSCILHCPAFQDND